MKIFKIIVILLISTNSFAGEWSEPLTVVDASVSAGEGVYSYGQLRVTFDFSPVTGICNTTSNMAIYHSSTINLWMQTWMATFMSAQAQNKKVRIFVRSCVANNVAELHGVKILSH